MWPLVLTRTQAWSVSTSGLRGSALLLPFSGRRSLASGKWCGYAPPSPINCGRSLTHALVHPTRYDFFYKNGVPKWRGTGYYYSRFRPGVGVSACLSALRSSCSHCFRVVNDGKFYHPNTQTVFTFLVFLTTGLQFMVQKLNYSRDLERIEKIRHDAKTTAWGNRSVRYPDP